MSSPNILLILLPLIKANTEIRIAANISLLIQQQTKASGNNEVVAINRTYYTLLLPLLSMSLGKIIYEATGKVTDVRVQR